MGEFKATFNFDEVIAFRNALKIHKAIIEASSDSAYELAYNKEYINICAALESVEKQLKLTI